MEDDKTHPNRNSELGKRADLRTLRREWFRPRFVHSTIAALALVGLSHCQVRSQTTVSSISSQPTVMAVPPSVSIDVPSAARALNPSTLPDPSTARVELDQAIQRFHSLLQLGSSDAFLRWNDFQKQLDAQTPDLFQLEQVERSLRQNYVGLDQPTFTRFREALGNYIAALRYGVEKERSIELLKTQLERLAEKAAAAPTGSDLERQRDIGLAINYLSESRQVGSVVESIRARFSRPNIRVLVSNHFLTSKLARPVSEPNPVREVILGTSITGSSWTLGQVLPRLVDNPSQATVRLELAAQFSSDNRGINRGVTILTRGSAPIHASETVSLGPDGLTSMNNTSVDAELQTDVVGIQHKLRIVRKIAAKKVQQQKPLANAIGEERLENRLRNQFHEQLQSQLSQANSRFKTIDPPELKRLGLPKPVRSSWSSTNYLSLLWKQQDRRQLAAPSSCPLPVESTGVTLQLHQSAIANVIDPVLSNRLIRNTDLASFVRQYTDKVPEKILEESRGEPWSITMASYHPVEVEFDDNLVKFRIRTTALDRGDQKLSQAATIVASYTISVFDNAIQLHRVGDVSIEFREREARGSRATVLRSFLKGKFDKVFRQELLDEPARPLSRLPAGAPAMSIASIQCDDGWIQVCVQ